MRYGAGVLEWRFDELTEFDRKNWKLFTIHKGLPPKSDIDRLYDSRKEGGRGLVKCGSTIGSEENNVGCYLKNSNENLVQGVRHVRVLKFRESLKERL